MKLDKNMTLLEIKQQIDKITSELMLYSLCDEQNYPIISNNIISFENARGNLSKALKNVPYSDIYNELNKNKAFNIKMLDGALILMLYEFEKSRKLDKLNKHNLSFFPSPNLEAFQNEPEIYEEDEIYADIISKNIVPFPIRFDFDPLNHQIIEHPKSHLTLGQYKNCRIPVTAPLTPFEFIEFILRNFYNTAYHKYSNKLNFSKKYFDETIEPKERQIPYLCLHN